jgi:hypothetical protein
MVSLDIKVGKFEGVFDRISIAGQSTVRAGLGMIKRRVPGDLVIASNYTICEQQRKGVSNGF